MMPGAASSPAATTTSDRQRQSSGDAGSARRIALLGNPNIGKTTLFNRLCGLRQKTSNFPGTTQEARVGWIRSGRIEVVDLPGVYSLEVDEIAAELCRETLAGELDDRGGVGRRPDAVCVVLDAKDPMRGAGLLEEAIRLGLPIVVALNMADVARRRGQEAGESALVEALGCPVVACSARSGEGVSRLASALAAADVCRVDAASARAALARWAQSDGRALVPGVAGALTERVDRVLVHPVAGLAAFVTIMTGLFWVIFSLAEYPMGWVDGAFASLAEWSFAALGGGILADMVAHGAVAGVGATLVFLPQIVLLFFLMALLEDSGYLARAAFVVNRMLRPFGLSGHCFVPLLSAHACALPGIMAARAIPDRRERLATILSAPFMTCTARIPVYVLLVGILFPGSAGKQALAFTGAYALGACAGLLSAMLARRSILRGERGSMVLELPDYQRPSLRTAFISAWDRALIFLKRAGTIILTISIVLWWLGSYPQAADARAGAQGEAAAGEVHATAGPAEDAPASYLERLGTVAQPVFEPLGYDRKLTVAVLASFAAREVFVSTMAVMTVGDEEADIEDESIARQIMTASRDDGTPIFTAATSWSLLVYYVLAMQCLPTLAVTAREAGGVRWALLQLVWMIGIAYLGALATYQGLGLAGVS